MFFGLTLIDINMIVQVAIAAAMAYGTYLSYRKRRNYRLHCTIFKWAVPVEIITVLFIMLPSMLMYIPPAPAVLLFSILIYLHHAIGLVAVLLWAYILLATRRTIKIFIKLPTAMKWSLAAWAVSFSLGFFIYLYIYVF